MRYAILLLLAAPLLAGPRPCEVQSQLAVKPPIAKDNLAWTKLENLPHKTVFRTVAQDGHRHVVCKPYVFEDYDDPQSGHTKIWQPTWPSATETPRGKLVYVFNLDTCEVTLFPANTWVQPTEKAEVTTVFKGGYTREQLLEAFGLLHPSKEE